MSLLLPSIGQSGAAGAPRERASFLPLTGSPAQRELPQKGPPPSLYRAAPRSGSSPQKGPPPSLFYRAALRSGSSPRKSSLLPPSFYIGHPPPIDTLGGTIDSDVPHLYRYNRRTSPADGYSRRTAPTCRYNRRMSLADGYNRRTQNSRR